MPCRFVHVIAYPQVPDFVLVAGFMRLALGIADDLGGGMAGACVISVVLLSPNLGLWLPVALWSMCVSVLSFWLFGWKTCVNHSQALGGEWSPCSVSRPHCASDNLKSDIAWDNT